MAEEKGDPEAGDKVSKSLPGALDPDRLAQADSADPGLPGSKRMRDRHGQAAETLDKPIFETEKLGLRSVLAHEVSVSLLATAISAVPLTFAFQSLNTLIGIQPEHAILQTGAVTTGVVFISLLRGDGG